MLVLPGLPRPRFLPRAASTSKQTHTRPLAVVAAAGQGGSGAAGDAVGRLVRAARDCGDRWRRPLLGWGCRRRIREMSEAPCAALHHLGHPCGNMRDVSDAATQHAPVAARMQPAGQPTGAPLDHIPGSEGVRSRENRASATGGSQAHKGGEHGRAAELGRHTTHTVCMACICMHWAAATGCCRGPSELRAYS